MRSYASEPTPIEILPGPHSLAVAVSQTGPPETPLPEISATGEELPAEAGAHVKATLERTLELQVNPSQFYQLILQAARSGSVTLLYSAHDIEHNNAVVMQEYLAERLKQTRLS